MPDRRSAKRTWVIGGATAAVIVVFGASLTASAISSGGSGQRTAVAEKGTVQQTLTVSGTVQRASQSTASFPTSGTVTSVKVAVGDTVEAGQPLATMDAAALHAALFSAQATLAQDEETLARDQSGSSSTGSAAPSNSTRSSSPQSGPSGGTAAALARLKSALAAEKTACAPVLASTGSGASSGSSRKDGGSGGSAAPTPEPTASAEPTPSPTPSPSTGGPSTGGSTTGPSAAELAACQSAMVQADRALQQASSVVERALASATRAASASSAQASARTGASAGTGGSSASASRIAADKLAILQDEASVAQAKSAAAAATLTAPISGTVARIDFAPGQTATSASGIVIVGSGPAIVTVEIPLSQMPVVKAGQTARVTPAGAAASSDGAVTSIDLVPSSSSSSSPTYPARIRVDSPTAAMAPGAGAVVVIAIREVSDAVRVPASALSGVTSGSGTVTVVSDAGSTPTRVEVGAVGGGWAQITSGLKSGQRVLLADPSQPLPSNNSVTGRFGGGLGGGGFVRRSGG